MTDLYGEAGADGSLIDPEQFRQFIAQDDVWTFEVTVTNPLGQKVTYTGSAEAAPHIECTPTVSGGIFAFALQVDRPTAVEQTVEAAGLPANAYDLVLAAREEAGRAKALLDGSGSAES